MFVVGLFALGLLLWTIVERRQAPPATADHVLQPVANNPQPSPPLVASSPAPVEHIAPPAVAGPPTAKSAPPVTATPSPRNGKVRFAIHPWGEVLVDGKSRGVSPPLKELSIPEGRHRIQIRNGGFPGYDSELDVKAGSKDEIAYSFKVP